MEPLNGPSVAVIIPTLDNRPYLEPCLRSLRATTNAASTRVFVMNNGAPGSCDWAVECGAMVAQMAGNVGWEGAIKAGTALTEEPALLFLNDDTHFPQSSAGWLDRLVGHLSDPRVGAVGPSSNFVSGPQAIWFHAPWEVFCAQFLIGFCVLVRRTALERVGGIVVEEDLSDDMDLSIRLLDGGYSLLVDKGVFVYHWGAVTGARLLGPIYQPGGWYDPVRMGRHRAKLVERYGEERVRALSSGVISPYTPPPRSP